MTTPDRTEDLLRLMLERRAGAPPPGWLLPGVAEAVRQTGQARGGPALPGLPGTRRFGRLALVAAAALVLLALAAGVLVAARLILPPPQPTLPAIVVAPSPSASPPAATPEPTEAPADQPQPPADAGPRAFAPDTIAVVTTAGDGLRVRSKPERGRGLEEALTAAQEGHPDARSSTARSPRTPTTGTRSRPTTTCSAGSPPARAARTGSRPAEPNCTDNLDESAVWTVDPIDFLVCYGDTPVRCPRRLDRRSKTASTTEGAPACPYTGDNVQCSARPDWLV